MLNRGACLAVILSLLMWAGIIWIILRWLDIPQSELV
jgi:hypothetical protein